MLPTSDDAAHDDALSSRIAALNILDLGLEHLDVVVADDAKDGVAEVLRSCGESKFCAAGMSVGFEHLR